jgi:hypothetical protein
VGSIYTGAEGTGISFSVKTDPLLSSECIRHDIGSLILHIFNRRSRLQSHQPRPANPECVARHWVVPGLRVRGCRACELVLRGRGQFLLTKGGVGRNSSLAYCAVVQLANRWCNTLRYCTLQQAGCGGHVGVRPNTPQHSLETVGSRKCLIQLRGCACGCPSPAFHATSPRQDGARGRGEPR